MEMKNTLSVEDTYIYLDPKAQARGGNIPRKNTPFKEAIVFVVGGGNYVEYQNLQDSAKVFIWRVRDLVPYHCPRRSVFRVGQALLK